MVTILSKQTKQFALLWRTLGLVWRSGPGWTLASAALILVQGALPLLSLYVMKVFIDELSHALSPTASAAEFSRVFLPLALLAVLSLAGVMCRSVATLVTESQGQAVTDHVHCILYSKAIEVDLDYYETPHYYDELHRALQEAPFRPTKITNGLVQVARSGLSLAAIGGLLLSFHWALAFALVGAAIPPTLIRLFFGGRLYLWQYKRTRTDREALYFGWMLTGDQHAKEIRLLGLGRHFLEQYQRLRKVLRSERLRIVGKRTLAELGTDAVTTVAIFAVFMFAVQRAFAGEVTLGALVMYYQALHRGHGFLRELVAGATGLYEDSLFVSCLFTFLGVENSVTEPEQPRPLPQPMRKGIAFTGVRFAYPSTTRRALDGVDFVVGPGEVVALVGENGSGKTTLVKLLCRLYDPTEGVITYDDIPLDALGLSALRRQVSVVFQDFARYQLTARENIWFGNVDLSPRDERIVLAARLSGADSAISTLTHGYDTILGARFEEGEELSIGEWQKVALARAFLSDAEVIVLDEPTSAMDPIAECEFFDRFRRLLGRRAAVLISHRFSTVRMADRIYVMENGKTTECGTHDELMREGGKYAELFAAQARYYC